MKRTISVYAAILLFLVSCNKDDVTLNAEDQEILNWLTANDLSATRDSNGIYFYVDSLSGLNITASSGDVVSMYYTLTDLEENIIESRTRLNGDSIAFKYNASAVYPIGIDKAIEHMKLRDTYTFILPSEQAYGSLNSGSIASDAIVKITIELVNIQEETSIFDSEIATIDSYIVDMALNDTILNPTDVVVFNSLTKLFYKKTFEGSGNNPLNGDTVVFDFDASFLSGDVFSSIQNFSYVIGSGQPRGLISGLETGLSMMQVNEKALLIMPSEIAYRESALIIPFFISDELFDQGIIPQYVGSIPPYSTLIFEVTRDN